MDLCLRRAIFCILFFVAHNGYAQAQPGTTVSSKKFLDQLAAFKEADDLEGWIYHRIEFVDGMPKERLGILMRTPQEAWRSYKSYTERVAWLYMLATQGYYQLQSGNILSSIAAYENALQFYESYPLPDADIGEYVLKPLGNNYTRLADYNTALYIHEKALAAADKKGDRNAIASAWSNLAACSRWKGDLGNAATACLNGIRYVDKKKMLYGLLLSTYADVLAEQKRYDTAAEVVHRSLQQLQEYGKDMQAFYWYTSALQIAARIAMQQSEFTTAHQHAKKALQLFNTYYPNLRQREKAKLYVMMGDIERMRGAGAIALENYQQALKFLLPAWQPAGVTDIPAPNLFYSENTFGDALAGKAAVLETLGKKEEALAHYLACFAAEKKLRAAFFYAESKFKELEVNRLRSDAAMRIAYALYTGSREKKYQDQILLIAELSKAQVLAEERNRRFAPGQNSSDSLQLKMRQLQEAVNYYQHEAVDADNKSEINNLLQSAEYELALLTKKLNQSSHFSADETLLTTQSIQQMLRAIPQNVSILDFFQGIDSCYIIEADASGINSVRCIPGNKQLGETIQQFMQKWYWNGPRAMQNAPKAFGEQSHAIYQSIFGDYVWKKDHRYILVPDGSFSYIPFDALITDTIRSNVYYEWPWLIKKAGFSQAWSLQTWQQQQSTRYPAGAFNGFFVNMGRNSDQAKLSVEEESKSLQQLVKGQYYINASATWQHFNKAADSAGVLHIGSHAMTVYGDSMPFLQLYDQRFYLFDLRYKKFSPALVVLGACKTSSGTLLQGEGVNSLNRGFTAAGAGGVVSGLWNVNDETAIYFMEVFYKKLAGRDAAQALQEAKEQWMVHNRDNPAVQLPYYWAGLIYSGHLQPVQLERAGGNGWFIGIGLLVLVFSGILFRLIQLKRRRRV